MRHVPGENEADGPLCAALGGIVATDSELSGANVVGWYVVGNSSEVRTAGPVDLQIDRSWPRGKRWVYCGFAATIERSGIVQDNEDW